MHRIILTIASLAFPVMLINAQTPQVSIADWKDGKPAATCFTFDDGLEDQYTIAAPELEKRGWRGTFFINGARIDGERRSYADRMDWAEVEDLYSRDHEIASHGWSHRKLTKIPFEEALEEISINDSAIVAHTGRFPMTFAYPYNSKDERILAAVSENRISSRTRQYAFGNVSDDAQLRRRLDNAIAEGRSAIWMTHGLVRGYDSFGSDTSRFTAFLDHVKAMEDSVWVATFEEISAYEAERLATVLSIDTGRSCPDRKHGKMTVSPSCSLAPGIYSLDLTLAVDLVSDRLAARQNGRRLEKKSFGNRTFFSFDPHGGEIVIKY